MAAAYHPRMQPSTPPTLSRLERRVVGLAQRAPFDRFARAYVARREQILFIIVGAWNTLFGYLVWAVLQATLGQYVHYLAIALLAWPIAVLNAYLGYRYLVFRSRNPILQELPRFSVVYVATLLVNLAILPIALATLPLSIYVIQVLFTSAVVVASYFAHRHFSFGGGRGRHTESTLR
jgi:putative flippase GtrA